MRLVDLTYSTTRKGTVQNAAPVVVRSTDAIHLVPLDRLITLATVVDVTDRLDREYVALDDMTVGVADISGCILYTGWCDRYLAGERSKPPVLAVDAAAYLLQGGVRTVAADFPFTNTAADLLLQNNCVLVHCLSNLSELKKSVVRLVALPLKLEDTYSAEARVVAIIEDKGSGVIA